MINQKLKEIILEEVCKSCDISKEEFHENSRQYRSVRARGIMVKFMIDNFNVSEREVADMLGLHRTTMYNAYNKVNNDIMFMPLVEGLYNRFSNRLTSKIKSYVQETKIPQA